MSGNAFFRAGEVGLPIRLDVSGTDQALPEEGLEVDRIRIVVWHTEDPDGTAVYRSADSRVYDLLIVTCRVHGEVEFGPRVDALLDGVKTGGERGAGSLVAAKS